jgi:hypothetical protein
MSDIPPDSPSRKISISSDDLTDATVTARVQQMQTTAGPGMIRNVGVAQPSTTSSARFGRNAAILAALGLAGGVSGALFAELVAGGDEPRWTNATLSTAVVTSIFALCLGCALLAWSGINSKSGAKVGRDLAKGLPIVVIGGALGGIAAQQIFYPLARDANEKALEADNFEEYTQILANSLHLPRAIGFMLVGLAVGIGLGFAARSVKRGQNAVIGGLVGGFIGGYLFDYIGIWFGAESGTVPRLVAFAVTGTLIGLGIGLVDDLRRDLWLEIASGGMAGKQFIVWEQRCVIGSDPSCDITLIKDPAIAPQHVALVRSGGSVTIECVPGAPAIRVDGADTVNSPISEGSMIQIGQTVLRVGQKNAALPTFAGQ